MAIRRIWIEEGCISCNLCEDLVSEVFHVPAGETCRTRKGYERLLGDPDLEERVDEAIESCPVEVIQAERDGDAHGADS
jgi:ferredoxin